MIEESEIQKLKSKYPDFFSRFSPDFLDFVFSEDTSTTIAGICLENGIEDEGIIDKITSRIALVLFGQVPKENLATMFEKGVGLNPVIAEKISFDIEEYIFSQIPERQSAKVSSAKPETDLSSENLPEKRPEKERGDSYREPIE